MFIAFLVCWIGKKIKDCLGVGEKDPDVKSDTSSRRCGLSENQERRMDSKEGKVYKGLEDNSYEYGGG